MYWPQTNPVTLRRLAGLLSKWGYEVVTAKDGAAAWEILDRDDAPRLAVLDRRTPELEGTDICRKVRLRHGVQPNVSRHYGGTGLGLTISLSLVKLMGEKLLSTALPAKEAHSGLRSPSVLRPAQRNRRDPPRSTEFTFWLWMTTPRRGKSLRKC